MTSVFIGHQRTQRAARPARSLNEEVRSGLTAIPKTLPAKLLYDKTGAELFERICTLPEYYVARAELEILHNRASEIAALAGPGCALIEYGSGAGIKVRMLLHALNQPLAYLPIDIAAEQLEAVAAEISGAYRHVVVRPICADYTQPLRLPALAAGARRVAFFPGSTIGNFHPTEAAAFLHRIRRTVGPDGALILGVDRIKDPDVLDAAYNDADGVTAAFNMNLLTRLNREFDADFDPQRFEHHAFFNPGPRRVEMHLVSRETQVVSVGDEFVPFDEGESIWTESSYKYDLQRLEQLAAAAGFRIERLWIDHKRQFWVGFLSAI
jgi:dimethylhistidine N-methyltransferase